MAHAQLSRFLRAHEDALSCLVKYEDLGNITYEGRASTVTALTSDAKWQIKRTVIAGAITTFQYANKGESDQVWDDRYSYFDPVVPVPIDPGTGAPVESVSSFFSEISGIADEVETLIGSYVVPAATSAKLVRVNYGGDNIAVYNLYINGTIEGRERTWFNGGGLTGTFEFHGGGAGGVVLLVGDTVEIKVIHSRPEVGAFESQIQVIET